MYPSLSLIIIPDMMLHTVQLRPSFQATKYIYTMPCRPSQPTSSHPVLSYIDFLIQSYGICYAGAKQGLRRILNTTEHQVIPSPIEMGTWHLE